VSQNAPLPAGGGFFIGYRANDPDGEAEWETELARNGRKLTRLVMKENLFIPADADDGEDGAA